MGEQLTLATVPAPVGDAVDFWPTPRWAAEAGCGVVPRYGWQLGCCLLEPSCGDGALLRVAEGWFRPSQVIAVEQCGALAQRSEYKGEIVVADFLTLPHHALATECTCRLAILNPPFSLAEDFVERCIKWAALGKFGVVAALLPLAFATGVERTRRIHSKWPSHLYPLRRRPKFGNDETGKSDVAWFVWDLVNQGNEWRVIG